MIKLTRTDVQEIIEEAREFGDRPNLSKCDLQGVNLQGIYLFAADLDEANLCKANLSQVDLREADLSKANLLAANLNQAKLDWANLNEAIVGQTIFGDLDLRGVKYLEKIRHFGPSVLDIRTLQRSQGQIPEAFLRGCGLSNIEIEYAKLHNFNLTVAQITDIADDISRMRKSEAIAYQPCFISYLRGDTAFAKKLHNDLQHKGIRCWYAPEDLLLNKTMHGQVRQSICIGAKLLLILSQDTLDSPGIEQEIESIIKQEQDDGPVLFPLCLDKAVLESSAGWVNAINTNRPISNFNQWKTEGAYQQAFEQLLRDLV